MTEENTEFEKAHGKAVTNFSHVFFLARQDINRRLFAYSFFNSQLMSRQ